MAYAKINNVATANMAKVFNVAKAGFGKIAGVDAPADAYTDNYSMLFDGTNDQVNVDDAGAVISGDIGSISMWFQQPVTAAAVTHLYFEADANNRLLIYHHGGRNEFTCEHKGGGTERAIIITTTVEGNGWHHFVYTWNTAADASVLYLDGSSAGTGQAADFTGTISNVSIGWRYGSGMYYQGNINDVAFFDDVLTGGEVTAIYQNGDPKDESSHSGLVGYWKFEENTGTSIADGSSNSNPATLVNGTAFAADVPWGWNDNKCIDGMDSTSKYLSATSNLPTLFTSASQQDWTIVMRLYHNATGNKGLFDFDFSGSSIYLYAQNFGQTLWWVFWAGQSGTDHQPMYSDNIANENATIIITKTGSTNEDVILYTNGGGPKVTNQNATDTVPVITSVMTSFRLGIRDAVFHFGGNKFNDFAIFDAAFTEAEATEAYNSGTTMDLRTHSRAGDLQHYWLMGDGAADDGSKIYDIIGDCDLDMTGMDADDIVDF